MLRASLGPALALSRRLTPGGRRSQSLAAFLGLAALAGLIAAGTAIGSRWDWFDQTAPPEVKRVGPRIELASDGDWSLSAWTSSRGLCLGIVRQEEPVSAGCGFPVVGAPRDTRSTTMQKPPQHLIGGMYGSLLGDEIYVAGVVAETVERAEVELLSGRIVPVDIIQAPDELQVGVNFFFKASIPVSRLREEVTFNARNSAGRRLDRIGFLSSPRPRR
jgi:hypothetical protein